MVPKSRSDRPQRSGVASIPPSGNEGIADIVQFAAVFGSLAEGDWDVRVRGTADAQPVLTMRVIGASVIEAVWPGIH